MTTTFIFWCLLLPISAISLQTGVPLISLTKQVDNLSNQLLRCRKLPGLTVAVARATSGGGRQVLTRAYGVADVGTNRTVDVNTRFCLAGATQSFTAAVLAQLLHENDSFTLDSTIQSLLGGWFQLSNPTRTRRVTVRDILSHRVGLAPYFGGVVLGYNLTRPELIRRLRHVPVMAPFRNSFVPNPLLYVLAGHLVQNFNGTFWENVVTRRLFKPLHMTGSTFADRVPNWANNFALPHVLRDGVLVPISSKVTGNILRPVGPSSSICSTAPDMAEWMLTLLRNGTSHGDPILHPQVVKEIFQAQNTHLPEKSNRVKGKLPVDSSTTAYSLGWFSGSYRGHKRIFQNGFANYYGSFVTLYPELGLGIFTAANGPSLSGMDNAFRALHYSITDLVLGEEPWINDITACTFPKPWLVASFKNSTLVSTEQSVLTKETTSFDGVEEDSTMSKEIPPDYLSSVDTTSGGVTDEKVDEIEETNAVKSTSSVTMTPIKISKSTSSAKTSTLSTPMTTSKTSSSTKSTKLTSSTPTSTSKIISNIKTTKVTSPLPTTTSSTSTSTQITHKKIKSTLSTTTETTQDETTESEIYNISSTAVNFIDTDDIFNEFLLTTPEDIERTTSSIVDLDLQSNGLTTTSSYFGDITKKVNLSDKSTEKNSKMGSEDTNIVSAQEIFQDSLPSWSNHFNQTVTTTTRKTTAPLKLSTSTSKFTTNDYDAVDFMIMSLDPTFGVRLKTTALPVEKDKTTLENITSNIPMTSSVMTTKPFLIRTEPTNDVHTRKTSLSSVEVTQSEGLTEMTTKRSSLKAKGNPISSGNKRITFPTTQPSRMHSWRRRTRLRNKLTTPATSILDDLLMEMSRTSTTPRTVSSNLDDFDRFILTNPVNNKQETKFSNTQTKNYVSTTSQIGLLEEMETYPPLDEQTMPKIATILTSGQFPVFDSQKTSSSPTKTTSTVTISKNHPIKNNLNANRLHPEFPSIFWSFSGRGTSPVLPTHKPRRILLPSRRRLSNRHRQIRRSTINYDITQTQPTTSTIIQDDITETLLKFGVRLARRPRIKKRQVKITSIQFPGHVGKYNNKFFGDVTIFFNRTSNTLQMEYGFYGKAHLIPRAKNNSFLLRFFSAVWYLSEGDDRKRLPRSVFVVYFKGVNQDGHPDKFVVPLFDHRMPPTFQKVSS